MAPCALAPQAGLCMGLPARTLEGRPLPFQLSRAKECCWLVLKLILCPGTLLFLLYSDLFFYVSHSPKVSSANSGSFNSHLPHYITPHGNFSFLITLARTFNIVLSISIKNEHSDLFTDLVSIGDFLNGLFVLYKL